MDKYYQNPKEKIFFGLSNRNEMNFSIGKYKFDVEDEQKEINSYIKRFVKEYNKFKTDATALHKSRPEYFTEKYENEDLADVLKMQRDSIFEKMLEEKDNLEKYKTFFYENTLVSKEDILKTFDIETSKSEINDKNEESIRKDEDEENILLEQIELSI